MWQEAEINEKMEMNRLSEILKKDKDNESNENDLVIYHVDIGKVYVETVKEGEDCLNPKTFVPEKEGWIFV